LFTAPFVFRPPRAVGPLPLMGRADVVINASVVGQHPTGLGLYTIELVRQLDRLRADLGVYTSIPPALGGVGAEVRRIPSLVRPEHGLIGHGARLVWTQAVLPARIHRSGARVLLNTIPEGPLVSPIRQVTVVHDLLPLAFPEEYPRQQHYFRHLVPRVLGRSRLVVADSESTRRDVLRHYRLPAEKVRVVYPGFDPRRFHLSVESAIAAPDREPYLLYVGNILPHKNLERLVEAFAAVRRLHGCRLVIRGSGRRVHVRVLRARIEALGVADAVSFVGYADGDSLRRLYEGAVSLVFPSLGEGFGLPVLEAMASGTPVITSTVSSLPEVAGDAALAVDPLDVPALIEAMVRVLTKPELRSKLRHRGFRQVEQFSWARTGEQVSGLLDSVLRAGG
jgi:glycosyltransferase involved in cell wall biosynthesis